MSDEKSGKPADTNVVERTFTLDMKEGRLMCDDIIVAWLSGSTLTTGIAAEMTALVARHAAYPHLLTALQAMCDAQVQAVRESNARGEAQPACIALAAERARTVIAKARTTTAVPVPSPDNAAGHIKQRGGSATERAGMGKEGKEKKAPYWDAWPHGTRGDD